VECGSLIASIQARRLSMTAHRRTVWLLAVFFLLAGAFCAVRAQHRQQRELARKEFQAALDQHVAFAADKERQRLDDGSLWIGALHASVGQAVSAPSSPAVDLATQRRIAGTIQFDGPLSATIDLHECQPGRSNALPGESSRFARATR
jgi:hypothetical protein